MKAFLCIALLLAIGLTGPFNLSTAAQDASQPVQKRRPKIGLVLSGGGARGFAHIGVLKVLEENHIPIDYIGGASMGALIGSLYAMGKSPEEIEALVSKLNWGTLLRPATNFDNLSFRRKEDRRNIPAPIILKGKINNLKLPNALNSGQGIALLFDEVTLPYASIDSFDELPIPFRAVGTDMINGSSVTLKSGSLARSLRATMSIPGVFSPIEVDGKILSDGGLVNNIPTDVVKEMGADILLVVNIETQLGDRESLESLPGVLAQTINIATLDNSRRSLRQADVIIAPDLEKYTLADFGEYEKIIQLGYDGAKSKETLLKGLSLNDAEWQAHLTHRRSREHPQADPTPEFIAVIGNTSDAELTIREKLGDKYTGHPLDAKARELLGRDLTDLVGTGRFDSLNYELIERDGKKGLAIVSNVIGKQNSTPTRLEVGFDVNSVEADNVNFNVLSRLTVFDVGRYGAEWRNDLRFGSNTYLGTEYYRPVGNTGFFIAPRANYERRRINFFVDDQRVAEYIASTAEIGVDAGFRFNRRTEGRVGYAVGRQTMTKRIGDPFFANEKGGFATATAKFAYDGLNSAQVPTSGFFNRTTFNYFVKSPGDTKKFAQAETRFSYFRPYDERNTIIAFGGAGTSFGSTAPILRQFMLGGPMRLGGYGYEQLRGSNYGYAGAGFLHNPKIIPTFLGGKTYVGAWYEGGSMFEGARDLNYRQSISGGAIIETPLGPIFVGGGFNENGRGRFYFSFGKFLR